MTTLYRLYGDDGLLYVGVTRSFTSRIASHAGDKEWFGEIRSATFEHYSSPVEALAAERAAIVNEQPRWNRTFRRTTVARAASECQPQLPNETYVDAKTAAHMLGVSVRTVHRLVDQGELPTARKLDGIRGARLFHRRDVQRLAHQRQAS